MEAAGWGRDKWQFFCNFDNARLNFRPLPACLAGTQDLKLVFHFDTTAPLPSSPAKLPCQAPLPSSPAKLAWQEAKFRCVAHVALCNESTGLF